MMQPWQMELLEKMYKYKGRGMIQITGRNTGKSNFSAQALKRLWEDVVYSPLQDIVLSEGTVYGARYYTAQPVGGNWREMEAWCYDTFGNSRENIWGEKEAPEPAQRWYMNNRKFWFRDDRDRMIFVLKWR